MVFLSGLYKGENEDVGTNICLIVTEKILGWIIFTQIEAWFISHSNWGVWPDWKLVSTVNSECGCQYDYFTALDHNKAIKSRTFLIFKIPGLTTSDEVPTITNERSRSDAHKHDSKCKQNCIQSRKLKRKTACGKFYSFYFPYFCFLAYFGSQAGVKVKLNSCWY